MDKNKNYLNLKRFSESLGTDLFGVADIEQAKKDFMISEKVLEKSDKAISLGIRLSGSVLEEIQDVPTRLYFHHYRTVNVFLDQVAFRVCNYIQKKGYLAMPIPASLIVDWQEQKAHLSHKEIGYLAGLGWIGRNNLLVHEELGSQFRLTSVLTDMPLKTDKPKRRDCQDCRRCVKICPSGAIKDNPSDFDHIKCFEKLKEFQRQRLVDQYICGICVKVCIGEKHYG
jgi:epoxyqueuosine reductase QueG